MAFSTPLRSDPHSNMVGRFPDLSPDLIGKSSDDESDSVAHPVDESPTRAVVARRQARERPRQSQSPPASIPPRNQTVQAYLREGTKENLNRNPQRSLLEHCSRGTKALNGSNSMSGSSQTSPERPAWIPSNAPYIEILDDEPDDGVSLVATHVDVPTTTGQAQTNGLVPDLTSANIAQTDSADSSDLEMHGSASPFSLVSQQETPRTDVSDHGLEHRQIGPERISDSYSTEDIILAIRDVICGWSGAQERESKKGYAYIFHDPSAQSPYYKIGHSGNVKVRTQQHQKQCQLRKWSAKQSPALRDYRLLEKLAHAELRNLRCKPNCFCRVEHREYFLGTAAHGQDILDSWSRWLKKDPYNDDGNLGPFWVNRLNVFVDECSGFFHCTAIEDTRHHLDSNACQACLRKGWQKFTNPTAQDIFEYDCQTRVPFAWGRLLLQACYSRFPYYETKLACIIDCIERVCRMWDSVSSIQVILAMLLGKGLYLTACSLRERTFDISRLPEFYLACAAAYRLFLLPMGSMNSVDRTLSKEAKRAASPAKKSARVISKSPRMLTPSSNQSQRTSKTTRKTQLPEQPPNIELFNAQSNPDKDHSDDTIEIIG
ncbi:hypothetical protein BDV32DRAFT_160194 [Aspergillus pseudonomiae]|uniref:Uncharacterized protein n=1 Tax=Aspergillus pseudonomiae TaxID=1506151 RepID=A0A5N7D535_9EURO|nr:uncharacterized protein BDV37DRAFT_256265 [Aspergillus pseudonomiae]KAB8264776.1 hypothetical protein BDV32DRAFT_160194 [Aspergillus pseudonomiae]KAE8401003.1 hypothetical protein BDV37DRAFT_256265 [Aspergillus pseudonomiae]